MSTRPSITEKRRIGHPVLTVPLGFFVMALALIISMMYFESGMWSLGVLAILAGCAFVVFLWYLSALEERRFTREYTPGWEFNAVRFAKPFLVLLVSLLMLFEGISALGISDMALEQLIYLFFLVLAIVSFIWMIISLRG